MQLAVSHCGWSVDHRATKRRPNAICSDEKHLSALICKTRHHRSGLR